MTDQKAAPPRRRRRAFKIIVAIVAALVLLAAITAAALTWYSDRQIDALDVETQIPGDTDGDGIVDAPELRDIRNVLVVGSDSREELTAQERKELGTGSFSGTRTDTIMLVQLDPERDGAAVLSFPRDLLVERCDGSEGRINGAYEIGEANGTGGPTCLVRTVSDFSGIPVNHYVQLDFEGFVEIVDVLGGVRMCLGRPLVDEDANIDLPAGCQQLSGKDSLGFARVRKTDSDLGRIERQQRLIRAIVTQTSSARVALDVPRLFRFASAVGDAVETDEGLSMGTMRSIAFTFRDLESKGIVTSTVPVTDQMISGVAYLVAETEEAEALFETYRRGVAASSTAGPGDG